MADAEPAAEQESGGEQTPKTAKKSSIKDKFVKRALNPPLCKDGTAPSKETREEKEREFAEREQQALAEGKSLPGPRQTPTSKSARIKADAKRREEGKKKDDGCCCVIS